MGHLHGGYVEGPLQPHQRLSTQLFDIFEHGRVTVVDILGMGAQRLGSVIFDGVLEASALMIGFFKSPPSFL
uniref:Uncharacterized protein n=1 Tax=Lepeophtheirus salmonis TaxID=72036 RepID=A0A0K2T3L5_LEPSM